MRQPNAFVTRQGMADHRCGNLPMAGVSLGQSRAGLLDRQLGRWSEFAGKSATDSGKTVGTKIGPGVRRKDLDLRVRFATLQVSLARRASLCVVLLQTSGRHAAPVTVATPRYTRLVGRFRGRLSVGRAAPDSALKPTARRAGKTTSAGR